MSIPRKKAAKQADTLAGRAQDLLETTSGIASEKVADARKRLEEALEGAQEKAEETWDAVSTRAEAADKFIRGNPYATLGVGIGIGVLIGFLLRSNDKD